MAACPTRFTNRTDLHRREISFSRKTTKLVHRRGSVAWRLALATFTARAKGGGQYRTSKEVQDPVRLRPQAGLATSQDSAGWKRASLLTGDRLTFLFSRKRP